MDRVRVAMVQMNTRVGDVEGNFDRMAARLAEARDLGANLVVFPELTLAGYPPEDLLFRPDFLARQEQAAQNLEPLTQGIMVVFGYASGGRELKNAAAVVADGRRVATFAKSRLPNYGVFDEVRYFSPGTGTAVLEWGGFRLGVSVCEDLWYPDGPHLIQARSGANLLVNLSASPFQRGKGERRERMLATRAEDAAAWLVWTNLVGAQDELVFDGQSVVIDPGGTVLARAPAFEEAVVCLDLEATRGYHRGWLDPRWRVGRNGQEAAERITVPFLPPVPERRAVPRLNRRPDDTEALYGALVLGIRDYIAKNGFGDVVVGLSGGIDSALTATLAAAALGTERVHGVFMPSPITSEESREDAEALAENLGMDLRTIPIGQIMDAILAELKPSFGDRPFDLAEENLQARIRGTLLMALSNKLGWLVLTTGNKSELATGYSTLYGDMAGGFAVLKDVLKTDVFRVAAYVNRDREIIPARVLVKPPSAELRPDQKDEDSLPPYAILDPILAGYVEEDRTSAELIAEGMDPEAVARAVALVDHSEYKRRQAPVGIKVTPRAFGRDRRMPITGRF